MDLKAIITIDDINYIVYGKIKTLPYTYEYWGFNCTGYEDQITWESVEDLETGEEVELTFEIQELAEQDYETI